MRHLFAKGKDSFFSSSILHSWMRSFALLILFLLASALLSYRASSRVVKKEISRINSAQSARMKEEWENRLTEIESMGLELENAPFTGVLIRSGEIESRETAAALRDMVYRLRVYQTTHLDVETIVFALPGANLAVTHEGLIEWDYLSLPADDLERILSGEEELADRASFSKFDWVMGTGGLYYLHSLSTPQSQAFLLIKVDRAKQEALLDGIGGSEGSRYITDARGRILFSTPRRHAIPPLEGRDESVILPEGALAVATTEDGLFRCVSFLPQDQYMTDLYELRNTFLYVAALSTLISLSVLIYLIITHYLPIRRMISRHAERDDPIPRGEGEYERINLYWDHLTRQNRINHRQIREFESQMTLKYLTDFCRGLIGPEELPEKIKETLPRRGESFHLVQIRINETGLSSSVLTLFPSDLTRDIPEGVKLKRSLLSGPSLFLVYLTSGEDKRESLGSYLSVKQEELKKKYGFSSIAVMTPLSRNMEEIPRLYEASIGRMEEALFFRQGPVVHVGTNDTRGEGLILERREQESLSQAIREGKEERALAVTDRVISRAGESEAGGINEVKGLLFSLYNVVIQTLSGTPVDHTAFLNGEQERLNSFFNSRRIGTMESALKQIISRACAQVESLRENHREDKFITIKDYVDSHLADKEMYLPSIADHLHMNPKYLTTFFRENQGTGLAEYIRKRRIEKACGLLRGGLSVNKAADDSGFSHIMTFNRTFKKTMGMTPSEYKNRERQGT